MVAIESRALSGWWAAIAIALAAGTFLIAAGWTGPGMDHGGPLAAFALIQGGSLAALWLAMALGLGCVVQRTLLPGAREAWAARWSLGLASALVLDGLLGSLGLLTALGGVVAWGVVAGGALLLLRERPRLSGPRAGGWIMTTAAAPAIAVLLLAACSAPGWLWSTEFGGYDALSYHLQLPREWLARGRIEPLQHNVYSFLPGLVEGAYLHLITLRGNAQEAAVACQLLHAGFTIVAAWLAGVLARVWWPAEHDHSPIAAAVGTIAVLATGWTIVVGSLAYNEMAVAALLAGALLLLREDADGIARTGIALGVVVGAACGAKLTAVGFVALPVALASAVLDPRRTLRMAGWTAGTAAAAVSPWLVRNAIASGNPVFPFLTSLLGGGHWSAEQAQVFAHAHAPELPWGTRLVRLWNQFLRFGLGGNPAPGEPWRPLWGPLPWLAPPAVLVLVRATSAASRRRTLAMVSVVLVQLAFWLAATHLQSRFLVPAAIPLAALAGAAFARIHAAIASASELPAQRRSVANGAVFVVLLGWSLAPLAIFGDERGAAPAAAIGHENALNGEIEAIAMQGADPSRQQAIAAAGSPAFVLNHLLPPDARVLLVGDATPWRYRAGIAYQTVWDRGPLSAAIRAAPDDPRSWAAALRGAGFTHVAIEPAMLERWRRSGWLDPVLTPARLGALVEQGTIVHRSPTGRLVVALP